MTDNKNTNEQAQEAQYEDPTMHIEEGETHDTEIIDAEPLDDEQTEVADMFAKLQQTEAELQKKNTDYLYLMAEFDNYRKRMVKEKADTIKNAAERTLKDLLPIVDDFERGLEATKDDTDGQNVRQGMELIYNKLVKYLESHGVKAMDSTGADFNADVHEAIATVPAPSPETKGKVIDTTTKGYTINDKVLRHAKVVVAG